jgi:hypothetical protein
MKGKKGSEMLAKLMKWVSIAALLLTALFWRSALNYQLLLDFVVCMSAIVVVQQAVWAKKYLWGAGFVVIALLFNPIVLVLKPSGNLSLWVVLACIATFAISVAALKTEPLLSLPSITDRNPGSRAL